MGFHGEFSFPTVDLVDGIGVVMVGGEGIVTVSDVSRGAKLAPTSFGVVQRRVEFCQPLDPRMLISLKRRKSVLRIPRQQPLQKLFPQNRNPTERLTLKINIISQNPLKNPFQGNIVKRINPSQTLKHNHSQHPHIHLLRVLVSFHHFRCLIQWIPRIGKKARALLKSLSNTKIDNLDLDLILLDITQDVLRGQVPMANSTFVHLP